MILLSLWEVINYPRSKRRMVKNKAQRMFLGMKKGFTQWLQGDRGKKGETS
jgi:hypothetical protein